MEPESARGCLEVLLKIVLQCKMHGAQKNACVSSCSAIATAPVKPSYLCFGLSYQDGAFDPACVCKSVRGSVHEWQGFGA